jgi:four helix bundle protein
MAFYFQNLIVWQKAFLLSKKIHECIKYFPHEEQYALTDQMRRSSLSIVSNIAE